MIELTKILRELIHCPNGYEITYNPPLSHIDEEKIIGKAEKEILYWYLQQSEKFKEDIIYSLSKTARCDKESDNCRPDFENCINKIHYHYKKIEKEIRGEK